MRALELLGTWPVEHYAVRVLTADGEVARAGDLHHPVRLASVSKPICAWAVLVAVEEGSLRLDEPVGPPGATVRHLLSHAGGYPFEGREPIARPGERRIYSNTGYDVLGDHLERATGMPFAVYLREAVLEPLGMTATELRGSPAKGVVGTIADLVRFANELLRPRLVSAETAADATSSQFPDLKGVVPAVGAFDPCPWGLGLEIKGDKHPHWMGSRVSAATFGHFGGSGTFVWVDPTLDLACVMLAELDFDEWGMTCWPPFNDAVAAEWQQRIAA